MTSRPKNPKTARNKNILVIGGSGSGKTRFFVKPSLLQMHSSYVVTDPKGQLLRETGKLLAHGGPKRDENGKPVRDKHGKVVYEPYRIKVLNTINFSKSMKYNPLAYVRSEKDILKLVNVIIANTKGDGEKSSEDFWIKAERLLYLYGDNVIEKHGINRDSTGDREKTRYLCGKQGIFTRDRALIRPGFIRQLETRASTRSASFFHALGSPGRPHNGGGEAGAYRTRNGAKPLKQGHLRAKRGPLGPSRKSQQQTKRTGFAAHGHSIAETAPEGKRASCANGALIRA